MHGAIPSSSLAQPGVVGIHPEWFEQALACRPEVAGVVASGADINYRAWGPVEANAGIVLIHGGAAHARWWDHVAPLLAQEGLRVVALDLSGHGESSHRERYELDDWADEVAAVVAAGGFGRPPFVVGHSMGGLVALRHALRAGGTIRGTVMVDCRTVPYSDSERTANEARALRPAPIYRDRTDALARFRLVPDQWSLPYVFDHVAAASIRAVEKGWTWKFDPQIFAGQRDFDPLDLTRLGRRLRLVRAGNGMPAADLARLVADGCATVTVEIPDAGHHVMLDRPLALVSTLRALLATW